jgi:hypothetical protein
MVGGRKKDRRTDRKISITCLTRPVTGMFLSQAEHIHVTTVAFKLFRTFRLLRQAQLSFTAVRSLLIPGWFYRACF